MNDARSEPEIPSFVVRYMINLVLLDRCSQCVPHHAEGQKLPSDFDSAGTARDDL